MRSGEGRGVEADVVPADFRGAASEGVMPAGWPSRWRLIGESLSRPYPVPARLLVLFALVPLYIIIPALYPPEHRYAPNLALDRVLPLVPAWSLVYGALYLFLIVLPVLVVRQEALIQRTVNAYLFIWITAYAFFFLLYPTVAPRPALVTGSGFGTWGLRALYGADPPYNCFPSLHVAHSFVSAWAAFRVHRGVGRVALAFAGLVAVSTLFTRQHYVIDVVGGCLLAAIACMTFLRAGVPVPELDRQVAPPLAVLLGFATAFCVTGFWLVYLYGGETSFVFGP